MNAPPERQNCTACECCLAPLATVVLWWGGIRAPELHGSSLLALRGCLVRRSFCEYHPSPRIDASCCRVCSVLCSMPCRHSLPGALLLPSTWPGMLVRKVSVLARGAPLPSPNQRSAASSPSWRAPAKWNSSCPAAAPIAPLRSVLLLASTVRPKYRCSTSQCRGLRKSGRSGFVKTLNYTLPPESCPGETAVFGHLRLYRVDNLKMASALAAFFGGGKKGVGSDSKYFSAKRSECTDPEP